LPGALTALATGELNRPDGLPEVVVGIGLGNGAGGVMVMEGPNGAGQAQAEVFATAASVNGLAVGNFDRDFLPDLAVGAGRELILLRGRDRKLSLNAEQQATVAAPQLERREMGAKVQALAAGDFDGDSRTDLAVLTAGGELSLLTHPKKTKKNSSLIPHPSSLPDWRGAGQIAAARLGGLPCDALLGWGGEWRQARVLRREALNGRALAADGALQLEQTRLADAPLETTSAPAAILPMRVNGDALDDLVMLSEGASGPIILPSMPSAIITVNSSADNNIRDNVLTLREAILLANGELLKSALTPTEQLQVSGTPAPGLDEVRFNIPAGNGPEEAAQATGLRAAASVAADELGAGEGLEPVSQGATDKTSASELRAGEGLAAPAAPGDLDTGFLNGLAGPNGPVNAMVVQPADGKIVIGGSFTMVNGVARGGLARLNPDGMLDTSFDPGTGVTGFDATVKAIVLQPDGRLMVGGSFTAYNGVSRQGVVRVNADGSRNAGFNPGTGFATDIQSNLVNVLVLQSDGKVIAGGRFQSYNGTGIVPHLARLNTNGSLDTSFNPGSGPDSNGTGVAGIVFALALQNDGKLIVGGQFFNVSNVLLRACFRLNPNGSIDYR
jgi:uncharacterized delta-60 repeat protein